MDLFMLFTAYFLGVATGVAYHAWIKPKWVALKDKVKDKTQ